MLALEQEHKTHGGKLGIPRQMDMLSYNEAEVCFRQQNVQLAALSFKTAAKKLMKNTPPLPSTSASTARPPVPSSTASDQLGKIIKFMQICLY